MSDMKRAFGAAAGAMMLALTLSAGDAGAACKECGTVVDVKMIKKEGEGSGVGAVLGGIAGGVLGHQVGSGRGKDVATVAGAAGGAYVGHKVEKSQKATTSWQVEVRMDEGKTRWFSYAKEPSYRAGDKVKVVKGRLTRQ